MPGVHGLGRDTHNGIVYVGEVNTANVVMPLAADSHQRKLVAADILGNTGKHHDLVCKWITEVGTKLHMNEYPVVGNDASR